MQQASSDRHRWQNEPLPVAREVAPHTWKITVPIPFPLRTVNIYALVGDEGWVLVDAGMGTPEARAALATGLRHAGLSMSTLQAIVLTHHHPDHVGLSGELQEQSDAKVYMHPIDEVAIQIIWSGTMPQRFGRVSHFFSQHGLPPTELWFSKIDSTVMHDIIRVPPSEVITHVEDGEYLNLLGERYRVIWTPGHSDGHICLFRERDGLFLAGDHVLPRITPNIGLYSERDRPNPLGDYLASLEKVTHLPAQTVLPGHGEPFADLAGRTAEISKHHDERELQLLAFLEDSPQHACQLAEQLFQGRLKSDEARRMGVAEVIAHLEHMRFAGRVEQHLTKEGILLYSVA